MTKKRRKTKPKIVEPLHKDDDAFTRGEGYPVRTERVEKCNLNVRSIPVTLRGQFKAACYERGTRMQDQLIVLMREYVKSHKGKVVSG